MACWIGEQVGSAGSVVGIDNSAERMAVAREQAKARGRSNVEFQVADAYSPRLPEGSFDLACCRLVLMHLRSRWRHRRDAVAGEAGRGGAGGGDGFGGLVVRSANGGDESVL